MSKARRTPSRKSRSCLFNHNRLFSILICLVLALNALQYQLSIQFTTGRSRSIVDYSSSVSLFTRSHHAETLKSFSSPLDVQSASNLEALSSSVYNCSFSNRTFQLRTNVPKYIIVGAQKSGTTALYEFLKEHPMIQGSIAPETHFFDWHYPKGKDQEQEFLQRLNLHQNDLSEKELQCAIQKVYSECFNLNSTDRLPSSSVFIEKTPSYLFLPDVPARIYEACFWKPKIIVILRNPIDRAYSHYRMRILTSGRTFEDIIDQEIASLHRAGLSQAPLRNSTSDYSHPRFNELPKLSIEEKKTRHWKHYRRMFTTNYLQRGMYSNQLDIWMRYFPLGESLHVINYELFRSQPEQVYNKLLKFMVLPRFRPNFRDLNSKVRVSPHLSEKTRKYLSAFFQPYNKLLADQLGEDYWKTVWDERR